MPISTNIPQHHSSHPVRLWFAAIAILMLTPLLLHPSVPQTMRTLHQSVSIGNFGNVGYLAHMLAYLVVSLLVVTMLRHAPVSRVMIALGVLLIHGVATEVAQLWIPSRDFDPYDMLCNLGSVVVAAMIWQLCIRPRSMYANREFKN